MKAAIPYLQARLDTLRHNEANHRENGRPDLAEPLAAEAVSIQEAVDHLTNLTDPFIQGHLAKQETFLGKIEHAINCHSRENGSDTPGFILAEYLANCLTVFDTTVRARDKWHVKAPEAVPAPETPWLATLASATGGDAIRTKVVGDTTYTSFVQVRAGVYRWSCNPDVTYPTMHAALRGEPFAENLADTPP